MPRVKVHLKEIIKYVLLLGLGVQIVLGILCSICWLGGSTGVGEFCKSLCGVLLCGVLAYIFLKVWRPAWHGKKLLVAVLGILTSPVVLQAGLSMETGRVKDLLFVVIFIALGAVLQSRWKKTVKGILFVVLLLGTIFCCIMGSSSSFAAKIANRCCYPHMLTEMGNAPQQLLDETGYIELREALRTSDGIEKELYPELIERYGNREKADLVCFHLVEYGMEAYTKLVLKNSLWDYVGYHFPLLITELQLRGSGYASASGYRYGQWLERTGLPGTTYWTYSVVWYLLSVLGIVVSCILGKKKVPKKMLQAVILLETAIVCYVLTETGAFDYTKCLVVAFLWGSLLLESLGMIKDSGEK